MSSKDQAVPKGSVAPSADNAGVLGGRVLRPQRKLREGVVVSDRMNKTRIVAVDWQRRHPLYEKVLRRQTHYYVHDEKNQARVGDRVLIRETRPRSRLKRWYLVEILGNRR